MGRQRELLRLSIILCMGLLFVMAGILLIVGKLAGKRPPTCWIRNPYRLLSVGRHVGWLTETSGLLPPPLEGASGVPVRPTLQGW